MSVDSTHDPRSTHAHGRSAARYWTFLLFAGVLAVASSACSPTRNDTGAEDSGERSTGRSASDSAGPDQGAARATAMSIRADGIGHVSPGMTIGELRAALPAGIELGPPEPYMVDVDAMPVVAGDDTLYVVLIVAGEPFDDKARINLVATMNTTLRTAEGIGPGSTLAAAATAYGSPTLSYSTYDESREYASFPQLPQTIRFRVQPAADSAMFAGAYDSDGEYNETGRFDPDAVIWLAMVLIP